MRFLFLLWVLLPLCIQAQSAAVSQFYAFPAGLNPAYVSAVEGSEVHTGYRRQWGAIQDGLEVKFAAANTLLCKAPLGFGVFVSEAGESFFGYRRQEGGLQIGAFTARSDRFSLHGGLRTAMGRQQINFSKLLFTNQLDPIFGVQNGPSPVFLTNPDHLETFQVGFGAVMRGTLGRKKSQLPASLGFSADRFGTRRVSFLRDEVYQEDYRIQVHGSLTTPFRGPDIGHRASPLYVHWVGRFEMEGPLRRVTTGGIFQYNALHAGLLYQWNKTPFAVRNTHALTGTLGVEVPLGSRSVLLLQYAFDGTVSGLGFPAAQGAHELIATFRLPHFCLFPGENKRGKTKCFRFGGEGYRTFLN
jgi:type IX secretion system PorP/SprF family membrane protein